MRRFVITLALVLFLGYAIIASLTGLKDSVEGAIPQDKINATYSCLVDVSYEFQNADCHAELESLR